jgi:ATP-dependent DNA helicase DinG
LTTYPTSGTVEDMKKITSFEDAEHVLAENLPNYESRTPQKLGAHAVEEAFANEKHLILEAGCGVGKSLATLIPAILSGQRTIVSTATKALQNQYVQKDIPFLQENLCDFTWARLMGRNAYFCTNRALLAVEEDPMIRTLLEDAAKEGFGGIREDFAYDIPASVWTKVCSDSDECADLKCRQRAGCFAAIARHNAAEAQIVVVNHALLCTDLMITKESEGNATMLGEYSQVIVDECHELKGYAQSSLGAQFSEASINSLSSEVRNFLGREFSPSERRAVEEADSNVQGAKMMLWMAFSAVVKDGSSSIRITPETLMNLENEWIGMSNAFTAFSKELGKLSGFGTKIEVRLQSLQRRAKSVAMRFSHIITADFADMVRWIETDRTKSGLTRLVIKTMPIDVAPFLAEELFSRSTVVMISATAQVSGSFNFLARSVGVEDFVGLDVGTVFDYPSQGLIYVPAHLPEPSGNSRMAWESLAPVEMLELVRASDGRALLLFTSYAAMKRAYEIISPVIDHRCLMQGQANTSVLTELFKTDVHSVLFATRTFFTGMDIQGDALSLVVIDKLPFASPSDPIVEATCQAIKARGGNDFAEFQIPTMSLSLEQAAGRLIRHRNDKGVVAILDVRLLTKAYGKKIMKSLPSFTKVSKIQDVEEFFDRAK